MAYPGSFNPQQQQAAYFQPPNPGLNYSGPQMNGLNGIPNGMPPANGNDNSFVPVFNNVSRLKIVVIVDFVLFGFHFRTCPEHLVPPEWEIQKNCNRASSRWILAEGIFPEVQHSDLRQWRTALVWIPLSQKLAGLLPLHSHNRNHNTNNINTNSRCHLGTTW